MSKVLCDYSNVAVYTFDEWSAVTVGANSTITPTGELFDRNLSNTIVYEYVTDVPADFEYGNYTYSPSDGWERNITLALAKEEIKTRISLERKKREVSGITWTRPASPETTVTIDTSLENQARLHRIYTALNDSLITNIYYRHTDDTFEQLDTTAIDSIFDQLMDYIKKVSDNEQTHAAAVDALSTVASVYSYDYSTGWDQ